MKLGVLKYPGGHGEAELIQVLKYHFRKEVREIWYKEPAYPDVDALFIGGGFPCFMNKSVQQCLESSPALQYLEDFISAGRNVIGFVNGFRFLCEAGYLPGAFRMNENGRYICKQVFIKPENKSTAMTRGLIGEEVFRTPIATAFGNYVVDESTLAQMRLDGQILFRYCDYEGRITESVNYTGSKDNIAGVCNPEKNVFGMIPQPERAISELGAEADGRMILGSLLEHMLVRPD